MWWAAKRVARKLLRHRRPPPAARPDSPVPTDPSFAQRKADKLARIRPLLRADLPHRTTPTCFDFLTPELRAEFNITDTANVSSNDYDPPALALIDRHRDGLVLDVGAGHRPVYLDNVVNFEVAGYESTDVRGVGERLPFRDGAFDAVMSFGVLEHVRDPFACAREIARVMKPGATLYCVVPFLQPLHGYPHHYYNMSHQGLRALFEPGLTVERQEVLLSGHPVWSLCWIVSRWASGLPTWDRFKFLNMRLGDLLDSPLSYLDRRFVTGLSDESRFELASTTALVARKPAA
jgi:SAM-dependent methyltransferase